MNLTETEKAYLAGIFDGEGTVGYYFKGRSQYHAASVAIYNSDPRIMMWIKDRIPFGAVVTNKVGKHVAWAWMVTGKKPVYEFLTTIRPYLIIKADQADLLISLLDAEQGICGKGKQLSEETLALRYATEEQLRHLKTAKFTRVQ